MNDLVILKKHIEARKKTQHWLELWDFGPVIINNDGSVTIDEGEIDIAGSDLEYFPVFFDYVHGDFDCSENKLTSLEGCPKYVGGGIYCHDNLLTTLEHAPKPPTLFKGNPCADIYDKLDWESANKECRKVWI